MAEQPWRNKIGSSFGTADYGQTEGDKFARNDLRTPEGIYFFSKRIKRAKS